MTVRPGNPLGLEMAIEKWSLKTPVRVTGHTVFEADILVVTISDGHHHGRGEAAGVYYHDDTPIAMLAALDRVRPSIEQGITRNELRALLPPGGARNAVDCALWALEAARAGRSVSDLAGVGPLRPLLTTYTIGADTPAAMADHARSYVGAKAIKLKLLGDGLDADRVAAVRAARGDAWLAVDANQGFTQPSFDALISSLVSARVELIEQPFPIGSEALLDGYNGPIPIAADESAQSLSDLEALVGRFQVVSIKLDKSGGLTEGLLMVETAKRLGLRVMVGSMPGTSLAMAPAYVLGQLCEIVDLDAPMFLAEDRSTAVRFENGYVYCDEAVWECAA